MEKKWEKLVYFYSWRKICGAMARDKPVKFQIELLNTIYIITGVIDYGERISTEKFLPVMLTKTNMAGPTSGGALQMQLTSFLQSFIFRRSM